MKTPISTFILIPFLMMGSLFPSGGNAQVTPQSELEVGSSTSNQTMGQYSGAIGTSNEVYGWRSFAVGEGNEINYFNNFATGTGNTNNGWNSGAIGWFNTLEVWPENNAWASVAVGDYNTIAGSSWASAAIGINNYVGWDSEDDLQAAIAMGRGLINKWTSSTVVGQYNDSSISQETPLLFAVGNGSSASARSNALEVFGNGSIKMPRQGDILMGEFGHPEP